MLTLAGKKVALQVGTIYLPSEFKSDDPSLKPPVLWLSPLNGIIEIREPDQTSPNLALLTSFSHHHDQPFKMIFLEHEGWKIVYCQDNSHNRDFVALNQHPGFCSSFEGLPSFRLPETSTGENRQRELKSPWPFFQMEYGTARTTLQLACCYQQRGEGCAFCGHRQWWKRGRRPPPEADSPTETLSPAKTISPVEKKGVDDKQIPLQRLVINTATLPGPDKGIRQLVEAAKELPCSLRSNDFFLVAGFEAVEELTWLERLKACGYQGMFCNFEIFDQKLRRQVMPAKGRLSLELYQKNWQQGLKLFGPGRVSTMIIAGLGEDPESIVEGAESAISMGINTSIVPFMPIKGSKLAQSQPPSFNYMARIYQQVADIYKKYQFEPFDNQIVCRRGDCFTAIKDIWKMGFETV